jgi:formylglycine-generating enzyme required for sulfatase activity/serine/threonine protein kinase
MTAGSSPTSFQQALRGGTRLEEFVVERILGSGGFGITYLARDSRLGRQVVIKENLPAQFCWRDTTSLTVQPRHTSGEDADNFQYSLDSFEKEAATLASLDHPGIVKVLRSFEANGTAYFVMPFVDGTTLDEVMREREAKKKSFSEEELTSLLTKVLDALAYLHERGIYHRDIKPGNILITHTGAPVLIDFGAARQRLSERSLTVIESPGYTPFEQMQSRGKVGPWSDLYALGGTLYKAITGETPAKAADRIMEDSQVPLETRTELGSRYSQELLQAIDHAMRPKLSERPQSAEEWLRILRSSPPPLSANPRVATAPLLRPQSIGPKPSPKAAAEPNGDGVPVGPVKAAVVVEEKTPSSISRSDLMWLWGGVIAIAVLFFAFTFLLPSNQITETGGEVATQPAPAKVAPPADPVPEPRVTDDYALRLRIEAMAREELKKRFPTPSLIEAPKAPAPGSVEANVFDQGETGKVIEVELPGDVVMKFAYCPPGSFMMGSPASEKDRSNNEDQAQMRISQGFWMGQYEVTQGQWLALMGTTPAEQRARENRWEAGEINGLGADHPMYFVSWEDAQAFISKLNQSVALPAGWKYALPTEAQWEYACRAGTESVFHFGSVLNGTQANCDGNSPYGTTQKGLYLRKTCAVGSYDANAWGLYDMHGNVGEWCADWFGWKLDGGIDPVGASTSLNRTRRGGSWADSAQDCRAACRYPCEPRWRFDFLGFRVALIQAAAQVSVKQDEDPLPILHDRESEKQAVAPSRPRSPLTRYPWKTDIVATVFWVGNPLASQWDAKWVTNFGGIDHPEPAQRSESYTPIGYTPGLNPFYVALPYNDCTDNEQHKPEAAKIIPWFETSFVKPGQSVLRGTWLALRYESKVCYAQWENCGPFGMDDPLYVFGTERPKNQKNNGAGISVSPAVRDFLGMPGGATVDWRFVNVNEIPSGPWTKLGMNNHFVRIKELRNRIKQ